MSEKCILQVIGKFSGYEELNLAIEGREFKSKLVSEALKKSIAEDAEIILYVPESMVTSIAEDVVEAYNYIKDIKQLEKEFQKQIVENHLIEEEFKVRIIRSAGLYPGINHRYRIYFINDLDTIIVYLFHDLLSLKATKIFVDISTGQNFYVVALLEALRHLLVYKKLENLFWKERDTEIKLSTIPPVIPTKDKQAVTQHVNFSKVDVKVFFEHPFRTTTTISLGGFISRYPNEETRKRLIQESNIIKEFERDFGKIKELLRIFRISFNALKYNAPLCFYEPEIINMNLCDVEDALNLLTRILEYIEARTSISVVDDKTLIVERIPLSRPAIINTFLTIALFKSIKEKLGPLNTLRNPSLEELVENFEKIYDSLNLGLNLTFLQREINNIEKVAEELQNGEEKLYRDLMKEPPGRPQDPKRNFFAHAGLTYDSVLVKKESGKIRIKYSEGQFEKIKEYLLEAF